MIVRKSHWLMVAALFVFGPIAGIAIGAFGGLYLAGVANDHDEVIDSVVSPHVMDHSMERETAKTGPASKRVVLPGGQDVALDELAPGRKVAIVVMKDVRCPVCQKQLAGLSNRLSDIKAQGGAVFGLSDASPCANRALMNRLDLGFEIVSDADQDVLDAFGMTLPERSHVMPGMIFIDENGEVEFVHKGRAPGQQPAQQEMIFDRL